jgi:ribosomal protein S18 acetylase RimI-like enzyme
MKPEVTIRPFREDDLAGVINALQDLQRHEGKIFDRMKRPEEMDEDYVRRIQKETEEAEGLILVAEVAGTVAGYCTLLTRLNTAEVRDEIYYEYARVGDLSVVSGHRGKGIGVMLLHECESRARAAGLKWISLGVLAGNTEARRFYAANGYRELGIELEKTL